MDASIEIWDRELASFKAGLQEREIRIQKCEECGEVRWPPRPACFECGTIGGDWQEVRGAGELFTWTVVWRSRLPGFADQVPYVVGIIALEDEPVRMIGRVLSPGPEDLAAGMSLVAEFVEEEGNVTAVAWRGV